MIISYKIIKPTIAKYLLKTIPPGWWSELEPMTEPTLKLPHSFFQGIYIKD